MSTWVTYCGLTRGRGSECSVLQIKCLASEGVSFCLWEVFKWITLLKIRQREFLSVYGSQSLFKLWLPVLYISVALSKSHAFSKMLDIQELWLNEKNRLPSGTVLCQWKNFKLIPNTELWWFSFFSLFSSCSSLPLPPPPCYTECHSPALASASSSPSPFSFSFSFSSSSSSW